MGSLTRTEAYLWYAKRMTFGVDRSTPIEPDHSS